MTKTLLRFILALMLLPLSVATMDAQTLNLGDFTAPNSYFNQSIGHTAPFSLDYYHSVTQQIYTVSELQGLEGKEITKLAFQLFVPGEISNFNPYKTEISIYLTNIEDDAFQKDGTKYKWLPVDEERDLYMRQPLELDIYTITSESYQVSTANKKIMYYTITFVLDKPFLYTGKSILLSVRSKGDSYANGDDARSFIDFCSYPRNVKGMPVRTITACTDKAINDGFVGVVGETADRGLKDRAAMQITYQNATAPVPPPSTTYKVNYRIEGEEMGTIEAVLEDGTAVPSGSELDKDTPITFVVTPKKDYIVKSFRVNGKEKELIEGKYSTPVTETLEVVVAFSHRPYVVTYGVKDDVGGRLEATFQGEALSSGGTTPFGNSSVILFTAFPDQHYKVAKWIVNGVESPKPAENNKWEVIAGKDYNVQVVFEREKVYYSVDVSQVGNGGPIYLEIDGVCFPLKAKKVAENAQIRVYCEPDNYHEVDYWMVNGERIAPTDQSNAYSTTLTANLRIVCHYKNKQPNSSEEIVADQSQLALEVVSGLLTLSTGGEAIGKVALYDATGRLLVNRVVSESSFQLPLPSGLYFLLSGERKLVKVMVP